MPSKRPPRKPKARPKVGTCAYLFDMVNGLDVGMDYRTVATGPFTQIEASLPCVRHRLSLSDELDWAVVAGASVAVEVKRWRLYGWWQTRVRNRTSTVFVVVGTDSVLDAFIGSVQDYTATAKRRASAVAPLLRHLLSRPEYVDLHEACQGVLSEGIMATVATTMHV